jgi:hypothetical protein
VDTALANAEDPNDKTAVEINPRILTEHDKQVDIAAPPMDKDLAEPIFDEERCQCHIFCSNCIPANLLLKGCWYEERTPAEQQQELACERKRRRQQGIDEMAPYRPIIRIRHHPDGRKLVFRSRGKCFDYLTLCLDFVIVTQPL